MRRDLIIIKIFLSVFLMGQCIGIHGQEPSVLEQKVSIEANNVMISDILDEISSKTNIRFSYSPKVINAQRRVYAISQDKTVEFVLNQILEGGFVFKERGNYVIIAREKPILRDLSEKSKVTHIIGLVLDAETEQGLVAVSVYTNDGQSTITDEYGFFTINMNGRKNVPLELRKKGFRPIRSDIDHSSLQPLEIEMEAIKSLSVLLSRDSVLAIEVPPTEPEIKTIFPVNSSIKANRQNITDTLYKPLSFSLYPGLSTYGNLSGNIVFNFALNIVGYNRGINGVEFGLLSNINRDNVTGVQLAGWSNFTGDCVKGYQAAGIFNKAGGRIDGVQMAGIANVGFDKMAGAQFAGISNHIFGNSSGIQMAGILNQADSLQGGQFAGILNLARNTSGVQMAGIGNNALKIKGAQIAGVYNLAVEVEGIQISGVVNVAKTVRGSQLGIFNVADTITGIPIGIFNYIHKGYRSMEVHANELFPFNFALKSGVRKFYSVLSFGMQQDFWNGGEGFYAYGLGFGTSKPLANSLFLDIEASFCNLSKRNSLEGSSGILQGYIGGEANLIGRLSLAGGVTYNAMYFDRTLLEDPDFDALRDNYLIDTSNQLEDEFLWRSWLGYRIGLRVLL